MTDLATIGLKVDSNGVVVAIENLDAFSAAGGKAEEAAAKLGKQATKTGAQIKGMAGAQASAAGVTDKLGAAQRRGETQFNQYGLSAKQQAAAMRLLPAQITDIVTSLVSGQPAYLVAIQQGGQLKDSFGGIAPAARALAGAFNPLTIAIGASAAAVGLLATAYVKAAQEQDNFNRAIINTGHYAGVTAGQLNDMADAIDSVVGTHTGAANTLTQLLNIGTLPGDSLQYLAQSAIEAQRTLGVSTDEIVKNYAELAKSPVDASLKLNSALHYLNVEQLKQIQSLIDMGRETDAARVALVAYGAALHERSGEADKDLSRLQTYWNDLKDVAGETWDAMLGVGRDKSKLGSEIAIALKSNMLTGPTALALSYLMKPENPVTPQSPEEAAIQKRQREIQDAALAAAKALHDANEAALPKQAQFDKALALYKKYFADLAAAGQPVSEADQALSVKNLTEKIFGPTSDLNSRVSNVQNALDSLMAGYQNTERAIEQAHNAGRLNDQDYYSQSIKLIHDETQAQINALQQQNAIVSQESAYGQKRIDNLQKIADNRAKISLLEKNAAAQSSLLSQQQIDANAALERSYQQSRQAAQNYLDTLERGYNRQIADFGSGPAARRYSAGRNQIDDSYASQRQQLQLQSILIPDTDQVARDRLNRQIALIDEFHDKAIAQFDDAYDRIELRQKDFGAGFDDAILAYQDSIANFGTTIGNIFVGALGDMQNAITEFFINPLDGGFKHLLTSFGQIIQKMLAEAASAQIMKALFGGSTNSSGGAGLFNLALGALGSYLGNSPGYGSGASSGILDYSISGSEVASYLAGTRANGGPVNMGRSYLVGENGRELFTPNVPGFIIPANQVGDINKSQTVNLNVYVTAQPGMDVRRTGSQIGAEAARALAVASRRNN